MEAIRLKYSVTQIERVIQDEVKVMDMPESNRDYNSNISQIICLSIMYVVGELDDIEMYKLAGVEAADKMLNWGYDISNETEDFLKWDDVVDKINSKQQTSAIDRRHWEYNVSRILKKYKEDPQRQDNIVGQQILGDPTDYSNTNPVTGSWEDYDDTEEYDASEDDHIWDNPTTVYNALGMPYRNNDYSSDPSDVPKSGPSSYVDAVGQTQTGREQDEAELDLYGADHEAELQRNAELEEQHKNELPLVGSEIKTVVNALLNAITQEQKDEVNNRYQIRPNYQQAVDEAETIIKLVRQNKAARLSAKIAIGLTPTQRSQYNTRREAIRREESANIYKAKRDGMKTEGEEVNLKPILGNLGRQREKELEYEEYSDEDEIVEKGEKDRSDHHGSIRLPVTVSADTKWSKINPLWFLDNIFAETEIIILDIANMKRKMDMKTEEINRFIYVCITRGITCIAVISKESEFADVQIPVITIVPRKGVTDDIVMLELSQYYNAPIMSGDMFGEFLLRTQICRQHKSKIHRKGEKCPHEESLSEKGTENNENGNFAAQDEGFIMYGHESNRCSLMNLYNNNFGILGLDVTTAWKTKKKTWFARERMKLTPNQKQQKRKIVVQSKTGKTVRNQDKAVTTKIVDMAPGRIETLEIISRISYSDNYFLAHQCKIDNKLCIIIIPHSCMRLTSKVLQKLISNDYESMVRATCQDGYECKNTLDIKGKDIYLKQSTSIGPVSVFIGSIGFSEEIYNDVESVNLEKQKTIAPMTLNSTMTRENVSITIFYDVRLASQGLAVLIWNDKSVIVKMPESFQIRIAIKVLAELMEGTIPGRASNLSIWPMNDDVRKKVVDIPFDKIPGMKDEEVHLGSAWDQYNPDENLNRSKMLAMVSRPQMSLYNTDEMEVQGALAIINIPAGPGLYEGGRTNDCPLFVRLVTRQQELPRQQAELYYLPILETTRGHLKDEVTVNCTMKNVAISSVERPASVNKDVANLNVFLMKAINKVLISLADVFKKIVTGERVLHMISLMHAYRIPVECVNPNAQFPVKFTYLFPYALTYIMFVEEVDHTIDSTTGETKDVRKAVVAYMMIVPSPGVVSAVADICYGTTSTITNIYNDMMTADLEMQAMDIFFSMTDEHGNMLDFSIFNAFSVYYAMLAPGLNKLGYNSGMTIAKAILGRIGWNDYEDTITTAPENRITHLEFIKLVARGASVIGKITPTEITVEEEHEIIDYISKLETSSNKSFVIYSAIMNIPGFTDAKRINDHCCDCFKYKKRGMDSVSVLQQTQRQSIKQKCVSNKMNLRLSKNRLIELNEAKQGIQIITDHTRATLTPSDMAINTHDLERLGKSACNRGTFFGPSILIVFKLAKDSMNRHNSLFLPQAYSESLGNLVTVDVTRKNIDIFDTIGNYLLEYLSSQENSSSTRRTIIISNSDKLPSIMKGQDTKSKITVDNTVSIYVPDSVMFSAIRSRVLRQEQIVPEKTREGTNTNRRSMGNNGAQSTSDVKPSDKSSLLTYLTRKTVEHKKAAAAVCIVVIVVLVLWPWVSYLFWLPTTLLSKMFAVKSTTWMGVNVVAVPKWVTYLGAATTVFLSGALGLGFALRNNKL